MSVAPQPLPSPNAHVSFSPPSFSQCTPVHCGTSVDPPPFSPANLPKGKEGRVGTSPPAPLARAMPLSEQQLVLFRQLLEPCPTPPPPCISYALVQATVGVGTVLIWDLILIRYQM